VSVYVGPARVLSTEADGRVRVQVLGGACDTTTADWAIPFRYEAVPGDLLLVLGQLGRYWVTGIVQGRGRSQMAFQGHTELKARGTLHLGGDGGVRLDGPEIRIESEQFESEAEHVVQRIGDLDSEIVDTIDERLGECARIIDEEDEQIAARHSTVAKHAAKIDGGLLRLS
jgi:hypothetical protein